MPEKKSYNNISVEKKEKSQVEITGEVPIEHIERFRKQAVEKIRKNIEVDGFRKGHVPENVLIDKVGEQAILQETAELALSEIYPKLITEHELSVIGRPAISITKLAPGNPIGFKILTAILHEITLPDYKKIAEEKVKEEDEEVIVTNEELEEALKHTKRHQAQYLDAKQKTHSTSSGQATNKLPVGEERKESSLLGLDGKPISNTIKNNEKHGAIEKSTGEELPELTDEFVKLLGDYTSVEDFTKQLQVSLKKNKERRVQEKKRVAISEGLIAGSSIELPELLIEYELDRMLLQFKTDIERMGMKPDEYYQKANTSEGQLRTKWRVDAEKHAKLELILSEIAKQENLHPSKEEVNKEMEHLLAQHKDADPQRARLYLEGVLQNENVFKFLEG